MNPEDHLAVKRLLSAFPERPDEALDEATHVARRDRVVSSIRAILTAPTEKKPSVLLQFRRPEIWGTLALAATTALGVGYLWKTEASVAPVASIRTLSSQGQVLCRKSASNDWVACDTAKESVFEGIRTLEQSRLSLETLIGVRLDIDASTTLLLGESANLARSSEVTLAYGRVNVRVPKLGSERQFSVVTPTATITVHGTAFSVHVEHAGPSKTLQTCVNLQEGVVSVTADGKTTRLQAPARWGCTVEPATDTAPAVASHPATPDAASSAQTYPGLDAAKRKSTIGQETRILQLALGAERRKDFASAEKWYKSLLTQYPNSIVAPEARAALERLSAKSETSR